MKRNLDLLRTLLLRIEQRSPHGFTKPVLVDNHTVDEVRYHLELLVEAGFVERAARAADDVTWLRLTWQGHEFLSIARSDSLWRQAKSCVRQQTGDVSVAALRAVLERWNVEAARGDHGYQRVALVEAAAWPYLNGRAARFAEPATNGHAAAAENGHRYGRHWGAYADDEIPVYLL